MKERNGGCVDLHVSAAEHVAEASKDLSFLVPALAAVVNNPLALAVLIDPLYKLYLAGRDLADSATQKRQTVKVGP